MERIQNLENVLPAGEARATNEKQKFKPNKRQGKASNMKNQEIFRERKEQEVERFGMLSRDTDHQLKTAINNVQVTPQKRAIPLTVATRGVGFVTAIAYERTCTAWGAEAIHAIITIHQVYRVHLWLVHLKVYLAQQLQTESTTVPGALETVILPVELREQLQTVTRVPCVQAMILDCTGKFQTAGKTFHMGYCAIEHRTTETATLTVNPTTIRPLIEALSTAENEAARLDFIAHNPIPGAQFVNNILVNGDDIWPANAIDLLLSDIHAYKNWITRVEVPNRLPEHFFSDLSWSGNATSGGLWSVERLPINLTSTFEAPSRNVVARRAVGAPPTIYRGFTLTQIRTAFWSMEHTPHLNTILGVASLVGEGCNVMTRFEMHCTETVTLSPTVLEYMLADAPR